MPLSTESTEPRAKIFEFVEEKLGLGLWVWDYTSSRMQWSRGVFYLLHFDYGSVEPSLDRIRALVHPDDAIDLQDVVDNQFSMAHEFRIVLRDNRVKWISLYGEMISAQDGRHRMIGYMLDVTARKDKEFGLYAAQARSNVLQRDVAVCFWTASRDGMRMNAPLWQQWTGQAPSEANNFGWLSCIHPDDRARVEATWRKSIRDGLPYIENYRLLQTDGGYADVSARATLVINKLHDMPEWTGLLISGGVAVRSPSSGGISGRQIRAAKALLNWTAVDLSQVSKTSISSIRRLEDYDGVSHLRDSTLTKIREALEAAGVDFLNEGARDQIIRLRLSNDRSPAKSGRKN